jgi:hypothetical protein
MALKNWLSMQREVASQIFESQIFEAKVFEAKGFEPKGFEAKGFEQPVSAAAERCGALELKTMAERAVDRVTHGMRLSRDVPAGT